MATQTPIPSQPTPQEDAPVIIAGAGPVGLCCALGLARHKIRSILLEKNADLQPFSRAILISTHTLQIFREWEILDRFVQAGRFHRDFTPHDARTSRALFSFHFGLLNDLLPDPGILLIPQDRTEHLLLDLVRATGLCDVRFNAAVTGVTADDRGVSVEIKGADAAPTRLRGRYLIGCDGAHSAVRESLGLTLDGKTYPLTMLLADISLPPDFGHGMMLRLALDAPMVLAMIGFDERRWRIISALYLDETEEQAVTQPNVAQRVQSLAGGESFELLWASTFHIHRRNARHLRVGRVFLAGDAGHLNSPAGGMGMNAGIQDAHNLCWKLAIALSQGNAESLLDSYETERMSAVVHFVDRTSDLLTKMALYPPAWLRRLMLRVVGVVSQIRPIQRNMMRGLAMLKTRYPASEFISGDRQWAGKIAPNCPMRKTAGKEDPSAERLFTGRLGKPTIVCYDLSLPPLPGFEHVAILPQDGHAFCKAWKVRTPFCAIVRPDGYIAWAMKNPTPRPDPGGRGKVCSFVEFTGTFLMAQSPAPHIIKSIVYTKDQPMRHWKRFLAVCLTCLAAMAAPARAADNLHIRDDGNFFSADTRAKADEQIAHLKQKFNKDLVIETHAAIPDDLKADYEQSKKDNKTDKFFDDWLAKRAHERDVNGIMLLICREPAHLEMEAGAKTRERAFTRQDVVKLRDTLLPDFKEHNYDQGLLAGIELVNTTMARNLGVGVNNNSSPIVQTSPTSSYSSWMCIIFAVIGLFILLRVISSLFRNAGGGGNFGPGYGAGPGYGGAPGYGAGGGGGGFMRGMLGGMLGGAAGSYLYDEFGRRTNSPNQDGGNQPIGGDFNAPGNTPSTFDSGPSDNGAGFSGGAGGDFGGGGDSGGGGGDSSGGGGDSGGGASGGDF